MERDRGGQEIGRKEILSPFPAFGKAGVPFRGLFWGWGGGYGSEATPRFLSISLDQKGKEVKVIGKKAEEFALQSYRGGSGQGMMVSVLNISWPSPQLERRQRRDPHPFGWQLLGLSELWAFGTHQRVTLARVPQLLPQHLPVHRGSLWERRSEDVGKRPQVPI